MRVKAELPETSDDEDTTVIATPKGVARVSDRLVKVAEPLLSTLGKGQGLDTVEGIITLAAIVWNLGSAAELEPRVLDEMIGEVERTVPAPITRSDIEALLERRLDLYPDDRRMVLHFEVTRNPKGGFNVVAASTIHRPSAP